MRIASSCRDDEVQVGVLEELLLRRVDDEVALHLADAHRADGVGSGTGESMSAAEAPFIARMSHGSSWSTDMGIVTSCVS
jgi:hypothetical protein